MIDSSVSLAKNVIDELRDKLEDMAAGCPFDLNISGASVMKMEVDTTTVSTEAGRRRWTTETIERDRYFLERLGITKECKY